MLVDIETLPIDSVGLIDFENSRDYPYFELLLDMVSNGMNTPIQFSDNRGVLTCIEGHHRFHVLVLLYKIDPEYFKKVIGKVEVIIGEHPYAICESPNGVDASWLNMVKRLREIYAKFIRTK